MAFIFLNEFIIAQQIRKIYDNSNGNYELLEISRIRMQPANGADRIRIVYVSRLIESTL